MKTSELKTRTVLSAYAALAIVAGSLAAACGDDADADEPNVIPTTGGKAGTGGAGSAGETSAGAGNEPGSGGTGTGGSAPSGGSGGAPTDTGGAGGGAGETEPGVGGSGGEGGGENCEPGEDDCYPCAPKTDVQYLNRCSEAECSPFDNAERIPGFDGTLPDL